MIPLSKREKVRRESVAQVKEIYVGNGFSLTKWEKGLIDNAVRIAISKFNALIESDKFKNK